MIVELKDTKLWIRVDTTDEDSLIRSMIKTSENIVEDVLRFPLSDFEEVPEPIKHAIYFTVSRLYEERENLNVNSMCDVLVGLLNSYRKDNF